MHIAPYPKKNNKEALSIDFNWKTVILIMQQISLVLSFPPFLLPHIYPTRRFPIILIVCADQGRLTKEYITIII